jgi:MoaA/NifB/PqqE/SkfB family radical SAM enzyme
MAGKSFRFHASAPLSTRDGDADRPRIRYLAGVRAFPVGLRLLASYGRYLVRPRRYPLFVLRASRGGLFKTFKTVKEMRLLKFVRWRGTYRYSLSVPRWPSPVYDRMAGLGSLNVNAAGTGLKQQVDQVILAVSRRCAYRCRHCYERARIAAEETVPLADWKRAVRGLQAMGTGIIVFSGGEPLLRYDDLLELLASGDGALSEFHIHTTGYGLTEARAAALAAAGLEAAGVGLDDVDPARHDALRGFPGAFRTAVEAIRLFQRAGVFTYINLCLTKDLVRSGGLPALMDLARDLGVGAVRFLEPVPVGGYGGAERDDLFSEEDRAVTTAFFETVNPCRRTGRYPYARHPFISYEAYSEAPQRLGCRMGGHAHFAIDGEGNVVPCVFLPVSFGNIRSEDVSAIYGRMRAAIPRPSHEGCAAALMAGAHLIGDSNLISELILLTENK